jgi:hypothetical protein
LDVSFRRARRLLAWLLPTVALAIGVLLLGFATGVLGNPDRPFELGDVGSIQFVLNTNAAALTSAMSVLIALVLLSVQLTAQRYSFNVIGIFIKNWVNAVLISFFILTIVFNLWLGTVLKSDYIPAIGTYLAMVMMTVCFALLPPYIGYLFDILRPDSILNHLQRQFIEALDVTGRGIGLPRRRAAAAGRISQIGDIARTAVNLSDSAVARHSVWVLYWSVTHYVEGKARMPAAWFEVEEHHFRGRHELILREIEETMTWVERRMLDEVQEVFYATLNKMHDVNNTVALVVRLLGEKAVERNDMGLLRMVLKFFNTFLRAAINQGDTRSGYHVLYQYRLLADTAMATHPTIGLEIADRLSYYGDAAAGGPLLWMSAAAAYDLRILAENSHRRGAERAITSTVVEKLIDTVARAEAKRSPALVQLYKTVAALGAFFLLAGDVELARRLRSEIDRVPGATREQIQRELAAVEDPVFWELTDRVVNFDYVEPDVRTALPAFLGPVDTWPVGLALRAEPLPASPT